MDNKLEDAKNILNNIGMPKKQQNDMCCYVLLAMLNVNIETQWNDSTNEWVRIHDMIDFMKKNYGIDYAENSRETIRKQALHHFRNAALIEDNNQPTNSPNYKYRITSEALDLIRSYNSDNWNHKLAPYIENHDSLTKIYSSKKEVTKMPVKINGIDFSLSTGSHNKLQKYIIEEFAPRFAPNSECLYIGDTIKKDLVNSTEKLIELGFNITVHDKMPDVVLYCEDKNWIYFIEAVTSVGPMSPKRILEIEKMTEKVSSGKIYITAFLDFKTFKKFSDSLAWETEVWIAEEPEHMIHLNGNKFMGPQR